MRNSFESVKCIITLWRSHNHMLPHKIYSTLNVCFEEVLTTLSPVDAFKNQILTFWKTDARCTVWMNEYWHFTGFDINFRNPTLEVLTALCSTESFHAPSRHLKCLRMSEQAIVWHSENPWHTSWWIWMHRQLLQEFPISLIKFSLWLLISQFWYKTMVYIFLFPLLNDGT